LIHHLFCLNADFQPFTLCPLDKKTSHSDMRWI